MMMLITMTMIILMIMVAANVPLTVPHADRPQNSSLNCLREWGGCGGGGGEEGGEVVQKNYYAAHMMCRMYGYTIGKHAYSMFPY